MVLTDTPLCDFGWTAPDFELADPDGRMVSLSAVRGATGTLVMFICNHCPYVRAVAGRLARDARELQELGIGVIAVMPNDYRRYPDDAPAAMREFAARHGFTFPYVVDETQAVARAYGAVCTPDFFGFDRDLGLQYRGRLDESRTEPKPGARRELFEAMRQIAETGQGPRQQTASMGCSIKWLVAEN
jgi:peroxiredoxin